ncbi:nitrate reductase [Seongchinamella unica]|uniref:Nitrate reductase n=1 Tax=Seongchinamella unica TaxID=2547392 RepID=A0A4R5LWR5_9GAMM|nr:nitrate reductase [Seongchinamella unica]TDG15926.1 nitrate reductase [Seongchinamella unica]
MSFCNTTCPYCGVGCGVSAELDQGNVIAVMGDGNHPANAGRLCVKGTALAETLGDEGRLLHPRAKGQTVSWDEALDTVAAKLRDTRDRHGPGSIAFYLSGQLLTEDYYVANKLMKGFLGSANVDTNSRLCMSSAVAAYKRAFGEDLVPCSYDDVESAELLVMVGSNAAWTHPVVYQRIVAAKRANPNKRVVVVDTRRTATCDAADLHLQIQPGSDAFLFAGLLNHLAGSRLLDDAYIERHTEGLEAALAAVAGIDRAHVLSATGLSESVLSTFYQWFGDTEKTVTLYSQGINQSSTGTDKCNAIINCHLATGRIGKPGAGPFSITGQPNAMGGREVGGLANQLAAHMDFADDEVDRVARFWNASDMASSPGLKAVDMFQAAADGKIRFLWIMATNPAVSLPDTAMVKAALERCDFVVVSDCTEDTDTARRADMVLPAAGWGEKDGTVTNSERVISRQRSLVAAAGEARPDWWMVTEVARRLGLGAHFDYDGPAAIFREHAALSAFENNGQRAFNIGGLSGVSDAEYRRLAPVRWPVAPGVSSELLADGHYFTRTGKAQLVPIVPRLPPAVEHHALNTGRLRDQWHTMTRTGRVPRLSRHRDFFSIGVSPADARAAQLEEGELVAVANTQGQVTGLVTIDEGLADGQVFAPIHWSEQFSSAGAISALVPALTDPHSGQPQSKFADVQILAVAVNSWGRLFSRRETRLQGLAYWSRIPVDGGFLYLVADHATPGALADQLKQQLEIGNERSISYLDAENQTLRELYLRDEQLQHAFFLHPARAGLPPQAWMAALGTQALPDKPHTLLAGCTPGIENAGALVCSCWEVGENSIRTAIGEGADSVEALGEKLRCGSQCGSCIPELRQMLAEEKKDCAA